MARSNTLRSDEMFLSEGEVARRLGLTLTEWRAKAPVLERRGFPRIDPVIGMRYWPAVRGFWNRQYGLVSIALSQPDGGEDLDALD